MYQSFKNIYIFKNKSKLVSNNTKNNNMTSDSFITDENLSLLMNSTSSDSDD